MKTCPVCQKVVTDQAKFCFFCGASLLNVDYEPVASVDPEPDPIETPIPESFDPEPEPEPEPAYVPEPAPAPRPVYTPEPAPEPVSAEPKQEQPIIVSTDSRSLMTTPGYIFTTILFHVPIVGLIFMLVWGCGKTKNLSRKRFSLAWLIMRLLSYIVVLAATVFLLICFSGKFPILTEAFVKFFS